MANHISQLKSINADSFKNDEERHLAVQETYALLARIEPPFYTAWRMALTIPAQYTALQGVLNTGLFEKWLEKNKGAKMSAAELNELIECDLVLLQRLLRHLAATYILGEDDEGKYEMTPFAASLITHGYKGLLDYVMRCAMPIFLEFPDFLQATKHKNPDGVNTDFMQHWKNMSFFEWLGSNPAIGAAFNDGLKYSASVRSNFTDSFHFRPDEFNVSAGETLLVDVGGNLGHDLNEFKSRFPNAQGRLIVQDQPHVIESAKAQEGIDPAIEFQAHDFFKPQPVKGAKLYLMHAIMHDWPDPKCKEILENLKPALKAGHSKLLIHDRVIPMQKANERDTSMDLIVMAGLSAMERTEDHWRDLITSAGYKILKIWRGPSFSDPVIETEVA